MEIKPYSKNAKKHPLKQLKQIAESIKAFGWQQPIVISQDGTIIVGHGRWFAYEQFRDEMGLPEPEIKVADKLTPAQVKAYRLADNKLNESDWDLELAMDELRELPEDLAVLTGFEDCEDIDFDNVDGNENREKQFKEMTVTCPECEKSFVVKV